jgi:hypothetical protein
MMKFKKLQLVLCLICILFTSACSIRLADFSILSTRNVNLDKIDLDSKPQVKGVVGKDTSFIFLFIPFGFPHLEDAVDDALNKGNGDVLIDGVLHSKAWWFICGQNTLEVKGTVVKTRNN